MDYFEVFELPRRLRIDGAELQQRFYALARRHHPDFHQDASPEARTRAEAASARVNAAYRTLRDPITRIDYLLRLEEGQAAAGGMVKPKAPPALLAEMFEIQEALAEARTGTLDPETREALTAQRDRLQERLSDLESRLRGPISERWDAADASTRAAVLDAMREALATRAYLRTVIDDLTEALREGDASVAHHRD